MRTLLAIFMLLLSSSVSAEQLIMARLSQSFPEAMLALQETIREHGYTVSRIQRVDIGLTTSGYHTDKYRIVFFAKPNEIRDLVKKHPQIMPYLPLKINIFAEQEETLINTIDPTELRVLVPSREFSDQTLRWKNDILSMIDDIRRSSE